MKKFLLSLIVMGVTILSATSVFSAEATSDVGFYCTDGDGNIVSDILPSEKVTVNVKSDMICEESKLFLATYKEDRLVNIKSYNCEASETEIVMGNIDFDVVKLMLWEYPDLKPSAEVVEMQNAEFRGLNIKASANGLIYRDTGCDMTWDKGKDTIYDRNDFLSYANVTDSRFAIKKSSLDKFCTNGVLYYDSIPFYIPQMSAGEEKEAIIIRAGESFEMHGKGIYNELHFLIATCSNTDAFNIEVEYCDGSKTYYEKIKLCSGYMGANQDKENFVCAPAAYAGYYNSDVFARQSDMSIFKYSIITDADKEIENIKFMMENYSCGIIAITGEVWDKTEAERYFDEQTSNPDILKYNSHTLKQLGFLKNKYNIEEELEDIIPENCIYVDPAKEKEGDGSYENPFNSINSAQELLRKLPRHGRSDIFVKIKGGEYEVTESVVISKEDSGPQGHPVTYTSYNGRAVFSGMKKLDMTKAVFITDEEVLSRIPESARGKVMQLNLEEQGSGGLGKVYQGYYGGNRTPTTELIWNDTPLDKARWPNGDEYAFVEEYLTYGTPHVNGKPSETDDGISFTVQNVSENFDKWINAEEAILAGAWANSFSMDYLFLDSIDTVNGVVKTKTSPSATPNLTFKRSFYIENLLEELDFPGEWYIDSENDILYFYPPEEITEDTEVKIAVFDDTVIVMDKSENVRVENIVLDGGRKDGIQMSDTVNCEVAGCELKHFLGIAVFMNEAINSGVSSCDVKHTADMGIYLLNDGSELQTLIHSNNYIDNCIVTDVCRQRKSGVAAIGLGNSVGNVVSHNKIYDTPFFAIIAMGNDNIVEYNDISNVANEVADSAAIYSGQRFSDQGNIYRYNYIHDIKQHSAKTNGSVVGIYIDDMDSGATIYSNIINRVPTGFLLGGGKNVTLKNNIIMNSTEQVNEHTADASIYTDSRGLSWAANSVTTYSEGALWYWNNCPAWKEKYPWMANNYFDDMMEYPTGNVIKNNIIYNHRKTSISGEYKTYGTVESNKTYSSSVYGSPFINETENDLRLKEDSGIYKLISEFQYIPFEDIGLYDNEYRD